MKKKVLIVGGVAGGASTAARLRRLDETAEIIMFERDEYISFANCGLPYYIGETITERSKLLVQTPEAMRQRFNIDVRNFSEVIGVNPANKTVTVRSKDKGTYEESFDYLVLSPGAKPLKPTIPGIDSAKIFTLRNIPDTDNVKAYVDRENVKTAVVIGGGFIGIEMAENLTERGLAVTLVEAAPHILAPFDSDMSAIAEKELTDNGVNLVLNDGVAAFKDEESNVVTTLNSGKSLTSDLVILAIGVTPDTGFLKESGIKLGTRGHILVNEHLETNFKYIYAVGDAIEVVDFVNKSNTAIPLAGPANKQGRIAADNIAGLNSVFKGTQGTSVIKVFSLTAACTGNNARTLTRLNIPHKVIYVHPQSHASYYPGALPLTLKMIFNDEGKILGAQSLGYAGVDKRIDVIATAMRLGGTVDDLTELELTYAPPYSSAKDPVNMAGFTAQNVLNKKVDVFTPQELPQFKLDQAILLDVRTEEENANGAIPNSVHIPLDDLRGRLGELDKNKEILVYCQVGLRGYVAARILIANGFKVKNLTGGFKSYQAAEFSPKPLQDITGSKTPSQTDMPKEFDRQLDACGLCCPGPLMQVKSCVEDMLEGQVLKVKASDPGFYADIQAWCKRTNNELLHITKQGAEITALIKKGTEAVQPIGNSAPAANNKTLLVFSGDLDKAIASFILANGAAAMGRKVTMFFTFWGLNILRKHEKVAVQKNLMAKMFSAMMPRGSKKLQLSQMKMLGMGAKMIRMVMHNKNVSSLEELIQAAIANGVEIVACQMSMDVMGITKEELIEGVKVGGVGYYLGEAEDSNVNLFI